MIKQEAEEQLKQTRPKFYCPISQRTCMGISCPSYEAPELIRKGFMTGDPTTDAAKIENWEVSKPECLLFGRLVRYIVGR